MVAHLTTPATAELDRLPSWATLVRASNPGPMTLDGTNTWVLRAPGESGCVVVDPGPLDEAHLVALAGHGPVTAIVVTHHHPDHRDGLPRLRELCPAAVVITAAAGAGLITPGGLELTLLPTPGHTADSISVLGEYGSARAVLTGDTILGRGTTIVAWPDGDLGDYLASLERLAGYDGVPVLPGHGPALADCGAAARFYLEHRLARLNQVRAVLAGGANTVEEVVAAVYADVDRSLWSVAAWSVRAQLAYLDPQLLDRDQAPASAYETDLDQQSEPLTGESATGPSRLDPP